MDNNGGVPNLTVQGATPQHQGSGYASTPNSNRQLNAYQQQTPTRPPLGGSHSYSRSSPAGTVDQQKYVPFTTTPGRTGTPSSKAHFTPQTPTGAPSQSPLALADIRPQPELHLGDDVLSPSAHRSEPPITQTNSVHQAPWPIYACDWCNWSVSGKSAGKMAICSYLEDSHNFISILDTQIEPQEVTSPGAPAYGLEFVKVAEATCSYPVTRILWEPPSAQKQSGLLATSGDHLRLWSLPEQNGAPVSNTINRSTTSNKKQQPMGKLTPLALLSNSKNPAHTAPLTSLDWNRQSPKLIITSSIDTTCTIWDIPSLTAKTQLIAHDKEVFDVRFCAGSVDTFVSCGADGSVRMFDLRSLEHSTIIYEPSEKTEKGASPGHGTSPAAGSSSGLGFQAPPLLRLAASPHDSHLLATFAQDSQVIRILDHRQPGQALLELHGHSAPLNCIEWSPSRRGMLASGGDDSQVLYWDLINPQNAASVNVNGLDASNGGTSSVQAKGPAASWRCDLEAVNLSWAPQSSLTAQGGDWLGVAGGKAVWGVKL